MKKLILFSIIPLLFLAFISCEKDEITEIQFTAKFDNTIHSDSTYFDEDGNLHEYITGIGNATEAGKSTISGPTTVYAVLADPPPDPPSFNQVGSFTLVADDGSTFIIDYKGTTSPGTPPVFFAGDGTYDIIEGSGTRRFVGTTGTGDYSYVATMDTEGNVTSVLDFIGTMTIP